MHISKKCAMMAKIQSSRKGGIQTGTYPTKYPGFLHGGDYNPDQWLSYPDILEQDPLLMKKAHCNTMSVGIFSWAMLEPQEGKFCFEQMDAIIDRLTAHGIRIVLATPSAARPRWMAEKYPEVRRVNADGHRLLYSERHNFCYTSPVYREKTAAIDRRLAEHYRDNPHVILWHISNELGGECHCDLCQAAFREWLKKKYDNDLDKLNHAWWSSFWSHNVTDWEQIHSPMNIGEPDRIMTGLHLDWRHFVTHQTTDFMKMEIDTVKSVTPNIPVTTNFMELPQQIDYARLSKSLDVISWDNYPLWHRCDQVERAIWTGFNHDAFRSFKHQPFLLMESTPSNTNWQAISKLKRPGMHRLACLQAVAHGSDSVQYFQWRKGRGGSEKFHGAVIDHNGKGEGRVFEDVRQVGIALETLRPVLGTHTAARIGLVYDTPNGWALRNASGFQNADKQYERTCTAHYSVFWRRGVDVDVIGADSDFSPYDLLILPMLYSVSEEQIRRIAAYVRQGGTVAATYATGYTDRTDLCYLGGFPGSELKEVFGLTADEIDTLYPEERNRVIIGEKSYPVKDYCELITPTTATVQGVYGEDFYAGKPAILKNRYGKGTAYYIGCRDEGDLLTDLYGQLLKEIGIPSYDLPEGVTVHSRGPFLFAENYTDQPQTVAIGGTLTDLETGEAFTDAVPVCGYGVRVLQKEQ